MRRVGRGSPAVAVATIRVVIPVAVAATVATAVTMPLGAVAVIGQKHHSQKHHRLHSQKHHRLSPNDLCQGRGHRLSPNDLLQGRGLHRMIRRPGQNGLLHSGISRPHRIFHRKPHSHFHPWQNNSHMTFHRRRCPRIRALPPRLRIKRLLRATGREVGMPTEAGRVTTAGREVGMPTTAGREGGKTTTGHIGRTAVGILLGILGTAKVGTAAPK